MQQANDPLIISIQSTVSSLEVYELKSYAKGSAHVKVIIESQAHVAIRDSGTHAIETVEIIVCSGAKVFWISDCPHKNISIDCLDQSTIWYVQVINSAVTNVTQRLILSMQESGAKAFARIFPLLHDVQLFECLTEQQHNSSATSSDLFIVGSVDECAKFGHKGMITVKACLHAVQIIQKTVMLLFGNSATAYACPCFDIASKDVRCTHGAALGSIDENQLWYLQSRGIIKAKAANMVIKASCLACLNPEIPIFVQELVHSMLNNNS